MKTSFIIDNCKRFNANSKEFLREGKINRIIAWISELYCFVRFGCSPDDYFRYEFYKKSNYERNEFITWRRSQKIIHTYNDTTYRTVLDDKAEFNKYFSSFVKREWIDLRENDIDSLHQFVAEHGEAILKPARGGQGHGIVKITVEDIENGLNYDTYKDYIAEEVIKQHQKMMEINNSSVNTVRVWTFKGKVLDTALRTGAKDSIVDNLHSEGVCAHLNEDYGIVDYPCINNHLMKFLYHPSSNLQLIGFQIPMWDKVKQIALDAAATIPDVGYIGWDVAIRNDGCELIEGNFDPGHDLMQMVTQIGRYGRVKEILKNNE